MPRRRNFQSPSEIALEIFRYWSKEDIIFLRDFLNEFLEPPQPPSQELPRGKRGGGYIEKKVISGKIYLYHRYIHKGKRRSLYIGKERNEPPAGIEDLAAMRRSPAQKLVDIVR